MEEQQSQPHTFYLELGKLLTDLHDYQQCVRRICKGDYLFFHLPSFLASFNFYILEAITYLTWSGKQCWNISEAMVIQRRSEHARKLLSTQYEKLFLEDCRLKSLISRLNRCSKEYSQSLFSGVTGVRISGHPMVKFDMSNLSTVVRSDFVGSWGGDDGVDKEVFDSFRDVLLNKFSMKGQEPEYTPRNDPVRVLLGAEFQHRFGRSKRRERVADCSAIGGGGKGKYGFLKHIPTHRWFQNSLIDLPVILVARTGDGDGRTRRVLRGSGEVESARESAVIDPSEILSRWEEENLLSKFLLQENWP